MNKGNFTQIILLLLGFLSAVSSLLYPRSIINTAFYIGFALANIYSIYIKKEKGNRILQLAVIVVVSMIYVMN